MRSDKNFNFLSLSKYENARGILIVFSIVIALLIVDTSIGKITYSLDREWILSWGILLFILVAAAYALAQYFILSFVKLKGKEIISEVYFINKIHKITTFAQYTLAGILAFVILQIIITHYYSTAAITAEVAISCLLGVTILVVLARQFIRWYRPNKNSVILLYSLSAVMLAIHVIFTFIFIETILLNTPPERQVQSFVYATVFEPNSAIGILNSVYFVSAILSFVLMWGATVLLFRHHYQKLHRLKFWAVVSIPLAYFLSQFLISGLKLFVPLLSSDPIFFNTLFTLMFTFSLPIGGILFGIAFFNVLKSIPSRSIVRDYIIISAFGFILFFVSDQTSVIYARYPPFGIVTISFLGLSSYLILLGIYSSATSLSQDIELRRAIRRSTIDESKLLDSIGTAQMEQELHKRVLTIAKKHSDTMTEETGVRPSLSENDIKQYLQDVIKEIKARKI